MKKKLPFNNKILLLGCGSIGIATLPLLFAHLDITSDQIIIACDQDPDSDLANRLGITLHITTVTVSNYQAIIDEFMSAHDLLINLTTEVDSVDLMRYTTRKKILYLDTCIEFWPHDTKADSSVYYARQRLLTLKAELGKHAPTALSSSGANPGVVSLITKKLILLIAADSGAPATTPATAFEWAKLARDLKIKVIHVNERDTQFTASIVEEDRFLSTWSVKALVTEAIQPAEMVLGTHEAVIPGDAYLTGKSIARSIAFTKSGKDVLLQTWLPTAGAQTGFVLNHNEPLSIADYFSISEHDSHYAPTVCFVYHPCEQTIKALRRVNVDNFKQFHDRPALHEIVDGHDELGVLIMTEELGSYWLGSRLDIHTARRINTESSATSLQVAAGVIAGACWVLQNPERGIVEPEETDHDAILRIAEPYWGGFVFAKTDWKPSGFEVHRFCLASFRDK